MIKFRTIAAAMLLTLLSSTLLTPPRALAASGWVGNSTSSAYAINVWTQPECTGLHKVLGRGLRQTSPRVLSVRVDAPSTHETFVHFSDNPRYRSYARNRCVTLSGAVDLTTVYVDRNA